MKTFYSLSILFFFIPVLLFPQGNALNFDGTNDYVQAGFSPLSGNVDLTVEGWFLSTATNGGFASCDDNFRRIFSFSGSRLELGECGGDFTAFDGTSTGGTIRATGLNIRGSWNYFALVKSGNTLTLFLNGTQVDTWTTGATFNISGSFRLGRWPGAFAPGEDWQGELDEIRVWNYARTINQITAEIGCELDGSEPGLVTYYHFNQGIGGGNNPGLTTLLDASPSGNNGALINFALSGATSNWVGSGAGIVGPCTPPCIAEFTSNIGNCGTVTFTSSNPTGSLLFSWDFGDGQSASSPSNTTTHTYATPGNYLVCLTISDLNCTDTQCQEMFVSFDASPPTIDCPNSITLDADPGLCSSDFIPNPITVEHSPCAQNINDQCVRSDGQPFGAPFPVGTTTVTCTTSDNFGSDQCSYQITVVDNQNPTIDCPSDQIIPTEPGACFGQVNISLPPDATDNCGIANVICTRSDGQAIGAPFFVGTTIVTCVATDLNGNEATCMFSVTVRDEEDPIFNCPDGDIFINTDPGDCVNSTFVFIPPAAFDNCDDVQINCNRDDGQPLSAPFPFGTTCITCTATDNTGNFSTCTTCIIVLDEEPPTITCPADTCVGVDGPNGGIVLFPDPVVTDNCQANFTCNFNSGDFFPMGETIVVCTAEDEAGNTAECSFTIEVLPDSCQDSSCTAAFTANLISPCGNIFTFNPTPNNAGFTYQWNFGDGSPIDNSVSPTHIYTTAGCVDVTLTIIDNNNCVATSTMQVCPSLAVDVSFAAIPNCLDVSFNVNATGVAFYNWNFGDGNTSNLPNPTHTYAAPGTYQICLTGANIDCDDQHCQTVTVEACESCSVTADFSFAQNGNKVQFTDLSTSPNTIVSWFWDFDDGGNTSTAQNPCYIYPAAGVYNVCLTVQAQDTLGNICDDTICQPIDFVPCTLVPDFNFSKLDNQLQLTNTSTPAGTTSWLWTANGQTFSTLENPIYQAVPPGPVTICLEATITLPNGQPCTENICKVIALPEIMGDTSNCGSQTSQFMITAMPGYHYQWTITGGHILNQISPDKVLINWASNIDTLLCDTLCVIATNGIGDTCKVSKILKTGPLPDLEILYQEICFVDTLDFNAMPEDCPGEFAQPSDCIKACENTKTFYWTLFDPGCTYEWEVVGGTIIGSPNLDSVCVQWDSISPARIKLIKTTALGCKDSIELCVDLLPPPEASISANSVCLGQTTQFSMDFIDADEWIWYFGDGSSSTLLNPSHTYATPGIHQVCLVIKKRHYSKSFEVEPNGGKFLFCTECVCVDTVKLDVFVDPLAGPDIECVATVCPGDTVCYNTNVLCPGPYIWNVTGESQILNGGGTGDDFICIVWGNGPLGTIELEVQNCTPPLCNTPTKVDIPILSDEFEIEGPIEVCNNESYVYNVIKYPGAIYDWEVIGGQIIDEQFNTIIVNWNVFGTLPQTGQIIVTVDSYWLNPDGIPDGNCWGQDTLDVMILPNMSISGPATVCLDDQATYTISPNSINVNWQVVGGTPLTSTTNSNSIDILWDQGPGVYTLTATAVDPTQVCEDEVYFVIEVIELPPPTGITGPLEVCPGETFDYVATGLASSSQFVWTVNGGTINYTSYNSANITWGATPPYEIWVKNQRLNPPICESDSINLIVNQIDVSNVTISGPTMPCVNSTTTYTAVPLFNVDYQWTILPATAGEIQNGQGTNQVDIRWSAVPANATIELSLCGQTITYPVQSVDLVAITLSGSFSCSSSSGTLTATPAITGATYEWYNTAGFITSTATNTLTVNAAGCYTVFAKIGSDCQTSDNHCLTDPSNVPLIASSPAPSRICTSPFSGGAVPDYPVVATQNPNLDPLSYTWTCLRNGGSFSTGNGFTFMHTDDLPSASYEYFVTAQTFDGCTVQSNSVFIIHDNNPICIPVGGGGGGGGGCSPNPPTVNIIDNVATPFCNVINFSSTTAGTSFTHSWDFGDGSNSTVESPIHTYSNIGYYTIELFVTVPNSTPLPDSCVIGNSVTVLVPVIADFTADKACSGNPVQFTDLSSVFGTDPIVDWEWDFDNDNVTDISGVQNPTHTFTSGGWKTVNLTVTTQSGCQAMISKVIEVLADPAVNFSAATQICLGEGVAFTDLSSGSVITTWLWDFGEGGATSGAQHPFFVYATAGTKTVTLTVTDIYGCTATTSQSIVVVTPQITSCDITPANPGVLCPADLPFTLTAPNSPSGQYLWSTGATTPTISVNTAGEYSVTIYDTNGCPCASQPVDIQIADPPPAVISGPDEICFGESAELSAQLPGGNYTYQWANSSGPIGGGTNGILTVFTLVTETYFVTVTDQNTNCASTGSHVLTVNPIPPQPVIQTTPSPPLCAGVPTVLTVTNVLANATYQWNTGETGISITVSLSGTYTVTVKDENGCTNSSSVTVNPSPEKCIVPSGCYEVCRFDTLCIPNLYDAYDWMRDGLPIPSLNDTCIVFDQSGVYTVKMTNSYGCMTTSDSLFITVIDCDSTMVVCDSVMVDYVETADTTDYCCFDLVLSNQVPDFFTMVKITPLTTLDFTNINVLDPIQWSTGAAGASQIELLSNTGNLCPGTFDRYLPTGTFTPVSFCLENYGAIPQQVLVEWIGCDGTICPDTLDFDCARCIDITNDTLVCDNGQLKFNFEFTNVWDMDICKLEVNYIDPSGATVVPDPLIFNSCIPVGGSSGPQTLCIDNAGNASEIKLVLQAFEDDCCWCISDTLCLTVPVCCDTCESIQYMVSDTTIQNDTCCFTLDVFHCVDDLFTGIKLEALGNIFFSEQLAPNDWFIQSPTNKMGTWHPKPTPPHGTFIPPGWNYDKIQFCLGGYDTPADVPQQVKFSWLAGSNNQVVCMDTLEFNCQPPPVEDCAAVVDSALTCLPNGDYQLDLDVLVLANFTVQQLWVRDLHSVPPGATFTPGPPVIVNGPFNSGNIVNIPPITIGNVQPGDSICFYITLFDNLIGDDASNHCCHTDTICIVIPEDLCPPDPCVCTGWNDFTVSDHPVNSWAINNVQCGDHVVLPDCAFEFWLDGSFNCVGDSCMPTHNWALVKQGGGPVDPLSNFGLGNQFSHGWDVTPNGDPNVSGPGIYVLQLNGVCSDSSTCTCMLTFEIPCDTIPVVCDTLDWSLLSYNFDLVYTDSCVTPDVNITCLSNGGIIPDWTEFDFDCDNIPEMTVPAGGYPISWNFGSPGSYQICLTSYVVIAGDTCAFDQTLNIFVPECEEDCEVPCWENFMWTTLNPGQFHFIIDMVPYNGDIIFGIRNVAPNNSVFRWDGSTITQMGDGLNGDVMALEIHGGKLYAGGLFSATITGTPLSNIAVYDDVLDQWLDVGSGTSDRVRALQSTAFGLGVGGHFTTVGPSSLVVDNVALWDGSIWNALGTGTNGKVTGLGLYNGNLVVGGEFGNLGNNIAVWDFGTSSWTTITLGSGVDGVGSNFYDGVWAMEQLGADLYIGGTFSNANNGGTACSPAIVPGTQNIAKWNGTTNCWESLTGGVSGTFTAVYDLKVVDGNVIAAGTYSTIGGQSINSIARWDGSQWNDLGLSVPYLLHAVTCLPDSNGQCELYIGGESPFSKLSMDCDTCDLSLTMPADTTICVNDLLTLSPIVTGNTGPYTCTWTPGTNLSSTTNCNPVFSASLPGTYPYSLTVSDSLGCDTTAMVSITVIECDTCDLSLIMPPDTTICVNEMLALNPVVTGNTGPFTCTWTPGTNLSSNTSCNPVFSASSTGTYAYNLTVSDSLGCDTTAMITITVEDCGNPCDSLDWPSIQYQHDLLFTSNCNVPLVVIHQFPVGGLFPDWTEIDFDCDGIPELTTTSFPIFWNPPAPGLYQICLTDYVVINGDTCFNEQIITIDVPPCPGMTCDDLDWSGIDYSLTLSYSDTCTTPELVIDQIVTGSLVPDWTEVDFDCDGTSEIINATFPLSWNYGSPGTYQICLITYKVVNGDTCFNEEILIVDIPECCLGCASIDYVISQTTIQEDTCCFILDLYHCTDSLYTGIQLEALGNIFFSEQLAPADWYITSQTADMGTWHPKPTPPHGTYIPTGWNNSKVQFCLGGYESLNDVPQEVAIKWLGGSNDNIVCTDTLEFFCQPPPREDCAELVDTTISCLPNGDYLLDFDIKILADFTVEQIKVRDLHSAPTGAQFNPANPIFSGPFEFCDTVDITPILISDAQPGDTICFYLTLFNNVLGQDASNHFCHTDTICIVLPPCDSIPNCEYLDWTSINYTCEYECQGGCITQELTIDLEANGDFVPDWTDIDLDCDGTFEIQQQSLPFTLSFNGPGIYDICIRSCEVIEGDTCCDERMKTVIILDCPIDTFECELDYDHPYLGYGVVTHFSGYLNPSDPSQGLDPNAASLSLYDVRNTSDAVPGLNWAPPVIHFPFGIAENLGQLFGVAVDEDGCIYAAATSIYLEPNLAHAHGSAGPGGIYKICPDGPGGWTWEDFDALSIFNLNTGSGLGNICYDPIHEQLFVTNFGDGSIYRMDKNTGTILSTWTFPEPATFATVDTTYGFIDLGQRIWAIGYHIKENRLYFSAWNEDRLRHDDLTHNEIWSIGLDAAGEFDVVDDHSLEITLSDLPGEAYSNPVADISFSSRGVLVLGERTMNGDIGEPGDSDFSHEARVLEYHGTHQGGWNLNTDFYVGNYNQMQQEHRNASGGVDYGYEGIFEEVLEGCDSLVWSTGDALRYPGANPDGGQDYVFGIAAMPRQGNSNVPGPDFVANTSLYVDIDSDLNTPAEGHLGDLEIFRNPCCNPVPLPCQLEVFINEDAPSQSYCLGDLIDLNIHVTGAFGDYQCLWFADYPISGGNTCDLSFVAEEIGEFLFVSTIIDDQGCIAQDSIEIIISDCIDCCQDFELFCEKVDASFSYTYTCDSIFVVANALDHCHTAEWNWGNGNTSGEMPGNQMVGYPISALGSENLSVLIKEYYSVDIPFCWDKIMGRSISPDCQAIQSMLDDLEFTIDESNLPAITITPHPSLMIFDRYDVDINADGLFEYQNLGPNDMLTHTLIEEVNNIVIRLRRPNCQEDCYVDFGQTVVNTVLPEYPETNIQVFPNPTSQLLRVVFDRPLEQEAQLQLYDLHGRLLKQQRVFQPATTLDLEALPAAVYLLKARVGEQVYLRKVVKE